MIKIGDIGEGGQQLSEGQTPHDSSLKVILGAVRDEFDALYAKLDADFTAQNAAVTSSQLDVNYASSLPKFEK